MTNSEHALADLSVLNQFKIGGFAAGYPLDTRTFYSPVDDLHGALMYIMKSARKELIVAMYGFDDEELAHGITEKLSDPTCFVQLTLDSSQYSSKHETSILAQESYPATSIAIGRSERGAIMHLKMLIVDGVWLCSGSTNWSEGGQHLQDNELTIRYNPIEANEARIRVQHIHANMLAAAK
jgi:phosphatidylserine/phosphatidylglycerophosphate/cardiolipin synthase-like enzyme